LRRYLVMIYPIVLGNIRRNAPGFVLDHKIGGRSSHAAR
jgi:hypothetical protein